MYDEMKRKAEIDGTETTRKFRKQAKRIIFLVVAIVFLIFAAYLFT